MISPVEGVLRVRKDVELDRETVAFYNLTICARDRGVPPLSSTVRLGTHAVPRDSHEHNDSSAQRGHRLLRSQHWPARVQSGSPHAGRTWHLWLLRALPYTALPLPPALLILLPLIWSSSSSVPSHFACRNFTVLLHLILLAVSTTSPLFSPSTRPVQMLVGIRVLDINDNDPVLLNLPMNVTISENSPVSSFVAHVLASDADSGCNALLTFNITAGNRERAFLINTTVGPPPLPEHRTLSCVLADSTIRPGVPESSVGLWDFLC